MAGGMLPAGEPMHSMWLRLTVDRTATIVAAHAVTDAGPYGSACGAIAPDYGQLVGLRVARGYRDAIRKLFGRTAGCTHINELAGAMGSASAAGAVGRDDAGLRREAVQHRRLPRAEVVERASGAVFSALVSAGVRGR